MANIKLLVEILMCLMVIFKTNDNKRIQIVLMKYFVFVMTKCDYLQNILIWKMLYRKINKPYLKNLNVRRKHVKYKFLLMTMKLRKAFDNLDKRFAYLERGLLKEEIDCVNCFQGFTFVIFNCAHLIYILALFS